MFPFSEAGPCQPSLDMSVNLSSVTTFLGPGWPSHVRHTLCGSVSLSLIYMQPASNTSLEAHSIFSISWMIPFSPKSFFGHNQRCKMSVAPLSSCTKDQDAIRTGSIALSTLALVNETTVVSHRNKQLEAYTRVRFVTSAEIIPMAVDCSCSLDHTPTLGGWVEL